MMSSFLFPEDLDPQPSRPTQQPTTMSKKCRDAFPEPATKPVPGRMISAPAYLARTAAAQQYKEPSVSISNFSPRSSEDNRRASMDNRRASSDDRRPSFSSVPLLRRFGSLSMTKQEREEQRLVRKQARMLKDMAKGKRQSQAIGPKMAPFAEEDDDDYFDAGRYRDARDHGFAHIAF